MTDAEEQSQENMENRDVPDTSTASTTVVRDENASRLVRLLLWFLQNGWSVFLGLLLLGGGAIVAFGIDVPRSFRVLSITFVLSALFVGRQVGLKALELMGGPSLIYIVDVDLLEDDGAGIYDCPTPRWRAEWTVSKDSLWWATPNLAFGQNVDLEEKTVEGTWRGSLPDPVLARALSYLRYNRNQLEEKARRGEAIEINSYGIIRSAVTAATKRVVETFESATLPDKNQSFHAEVDAALQDYGLDDGDLLDPEGDAGEDVDLDLDWSGPDFDDTAEGATADD